MRTTLTLDDDVAAALKQQAKLHDQSFKQVVNDALRRGLTSPEPRDRPPFKVRTFAGGFRPGIDPRKLNEVNAELELTELQRKLQQ